MSTSSRSTLLVFTLGAACESRRRRLLPAACEDVERRLHQACLDAVLDAGREVGCRLEVAAPAALELPADARRRPQQGAGFGARLEHAWRAAFAERQGPVVLVGSDAPGFSARPLRHALELLAGDPDRVVLGPSPDGGFYLLAAARPLGDVLSEVCWCSPETLRSLRRALARAGRRVTLLRPLADLDRRADLERWLATASGLTKIVWRRLAALLRRVLSALRSRGFFADLHAPALLEAWHLPLTRGPPAMA